ncbi:MAG: hypothetical protein M0R40_05640 [Firmicutes bacterium]|nr:hypothetical protein [Bacillota bacterium]
MKKVCMKTLGLLLSCIIVLAGIPVGVAAEESILSGNNFAPSNPLYGSTPKIATGATYSWQPGVSVFK